MALAIIGGRPERFVPFAELHRRAAAEAGHEPQPPLSINSHGYVAETSQQAGDEFFPAYAAMMNRIGKERGWPGSHATGLQRPAHEARRARRRQPRRGAREDPLPARALRPPAVHGADERRLAAARAGAAVDRAVRHRGRTGGSGPRSPGGPPDRRADAARLEAADLRALRRDPQPTAIRSTRGSVGARFATSFSARTSQSPLPAERRHDFPGLPLYPYDPALRVLGDGRAGGARAARDRDVGRAAVLVHAVRAGPVRARWPADARPLLARRLRRRGLPPVRRRDQRHARPTAPAATCSTPSKEPTSARRTAASCSTSTSPTTRRAPTTRAGSARWRRPATASLWPCGAVSGSLTRLRQSPRGRPLPQVPPPDLRGGRRSGSGRADAHERDRAGQGAPGVPLRRPARHRQDIPGSDPRQVGELPARADGDTRQHLPFVRRDHRTAPRST